MGKPRCPHCGSKDCKERFFTFDKMFVYLNNFGEEAIRSLFSGGKMDYQKALNGTIQDREWNKATNKEKSYRCKTRGYIWESKK